MKDAYLAGLIDGEGTIRLDKNYTSSNPDLFGIPVLTISSTTVEIMEWLKTTYGGCVSSKKSYQSHHLASYVWKVEYRRCIEILSTILPLLLVPEKIHRAKLLVREYPNLTKRNGKYSEQDLLDLRDFKSRFYLV